MIEDHDKLFVASEIVHFGGIGILGFKLLSKRNCGGETLAAMGHRVVLACM